MKMIRTHRAPPRWTTQRAALTVSMMVSLIAMMSVVAPASAQSIEDKLRTQLRTTTQQLRELQDAQAQLQVEKTDAQQQRDKAEADAKQAQADLAAAKGKSTAQAAAEHALAIEKASHARDAEELQKIKSAYADLQVQSHSADMERGQAQNQLKTVGTQLQTCEAKNIRLYQVGHEILAAYEHVDFETVLRTREPFAQSARVKYDQIAQDFGDELYEGKFDPQAPTAAAAAGASAPTNAK